MPAYNPGGYEGTSTSQVNPDGGGLGGLFSEGADWFGETIGDLVGASGKVLEGIQNWKWSDLQFDIAKSQLQSGSQTFNPTSAPAATYVPTSSGAGNIGMYLLIGGAVLAAVLWLPKLLK